MYVVVLNSPLPGIRSEVFVFYTDSEAFEVQPCIHSQYPDAETTLHKSGEPTEVFEHWSF